MDMLKIAYDIGLQTAFGEEFGKEAVDWEAMFPTFRKWLGIAPEMGHRIAPPGLAKRLISKTVQNAEPARVFHIRPTDLKPPVTAADAAAKARRAFAESRRAA